MKKIILFLLLFFLINTKVIWYNPTINDISLLNKFQDKINIINNTNQNKILIIYNKLKQLNNNNFNDRIKFLMYNVLSFLKTHIDNNSYIVSRVIDWDTVSLRSNIWKKIVVRMIWIDSPESYKTRYWYIECYWDESKKYLKNQIEWKKVYLMFDKSQWKQGKYGRTLAYLLLDGININWEMIKKGFAWEYTYKNKYFFSKDFKKNQKYAKNNKLWLWSDKTCKWSRKQISQKIIKKKNIIINNIQYSCSSKKYCSQIKTCDEANYFLHTCKLKRLDRDKDGIPCESICN